MSSAELIEAAQLLARAAEILTRLAAAPTPPSPPLPVATLPVVPKYLTTREAVATLGVTAKGLEALRSRGAGPPYVRVGRLVRYLASELPRTKLK